MNPGTGSAPHAPNAKSIRLWNTLSRLARGEPSSGGGAGAVRRGVSRRRGVATHYLRVNQSYERRAVSPGGVAIAQQLRGVTVPSWCVFDYLWGGALSQHAPRTAGCSRRPARTCSSRRRTPRAAGGSSAPVPAGVVGPQPAVDSSSGF